MGGRPPPNEDGTPPETLADQVTRLRQLLSVLETQYSGDTVLLVFPDGTGPALLSCLIAGIPLYRVHELEYKPGEVRLDISYESTRRLLDGPSTEYLEIIQEGKEELERLKSLDPDAVVNVKDLRYEQERKAEEDRSKQRAEQLSREREEEERKRVERLNQIKQEQERKNMERINEAREARRREEERNQIRAERMRLEKEERERKKMEQRVAVETIPSPSSSGADTTVTNDPNQLVAALTAIGVVGVSSMLAGSNDEEEFSSGMSTSNQTDTIDDYISNTASNATTNDSTVILDHEVLSNNMTEATKGMKNDMNATATNTVIDTIDKETQIDSRNNITSVASATVSSHQNNTNISDCIESDEGDVLLGENSTISTSLDDGVVSPQTIANQEETKPSIIEKQSISIISPTQQDSSPQSTTSDEMDYDNAWLGVLSDIINEDSDNDSSSTAEL